MKDTFGEEGREGLTPCHPWWGTFPNKRTRHAWCDLTAISRTLLHSELLIHYHMSIFPFFPDFFFFLIGSIFSCPSLSNWVGWIQQYIFSASILNQLLLCDTIFGFLYIDYFPLIYLFLADIYQHSSEHADQHKLLSVIRLFN